MYNEIWIRLIFLDVLELKLVRRIFIASALNKAMSCLFIILRRLFMKLLTILSRTLLATATLLFFSGSSFAQTKDEVNIRKNLATHDIFFKNINEVSKTPIAGLYEVRINADIYYTDAEGSYLIRGSIIDMKAKRDLTAERINKLLTIDFNSLPLKDAITIVHGNGKRKMAVFEDPNCGYCKRFEQDLQKVENVTVYMFLYPVLGADSTEKSKNILCAKAPSEVWGNWMVKNQPIAVPDVKCDTSSLDRNISFGRSNKITGTPTIIFEDGSRIPGAIDHSKIEKELGERSGK